ncbi:hypothetical protein [Streptomyces sp. NPDC001137]|uniref:hypothetical protein n=1 Tax=Streptomyces sp. NPDC001137 TaxID=3154378 RepID=UPI00332F6F6F
MSALRQIEHRRLDGTLRRGTAEVPVFPQPGEHGGDGLALLEELRDTGVDAGGAAHGGGVAGAPVPVDQQPLPAVAAAQQGAYDRKDLLVDALARSSGRARATSRTCSCLACSCWARNCSW